jgi:hypothetical protein
MWIDRREQLAAAVERWRAGAAPGGVALDTEFVFERTFRPRLGLIQIAAGGEIALVDTVRIADLSPLAALLTAPNVRKIVHSGSGDVPILRRATGASPQPLFDTQIAAAFAGLGPSLSYAALIRELFAVELPKHETRTDWLRRPLSTDQLRYAAEDVEQLEAAATELERRLRELGRLEWALEDSAELSLLESDAADASVAWRRVKVSTACRRTVERSPARSPPGASAKPTASTSRALSCCATRPCSPSRAATPSRRRRSPSSRASRRVAMRSMLRVGSRRSTRRAPPSKPERRRRNPLAFRPRSVNAAARSRMRSRRSSAVAPASSASRPSSFSPAASATARSPPGATAEAARSPRASAASAAASSEPSSTRSLAGEALLAPAFRTRLT